MPLSHEPLQQLYLVGKGIIESVEEKAKLIVALRRQGKTYREVQKLLKVSPKDIARASRLEVRKDDIEGLKGRVGRLEIKLSSLEKALAELCGFRAEILELKAGLNAGWIGGSGRILSVASTWSKASVKPGAGRSPLKGGA